MTRYHKASFRSLTYPEIDKIYRRIIEFRDSFGLRPNPQMRAEAMIGACIVEGVDTQYEIVKMLGGRGLSKDLVRRTLEERTGPLPGEFLWQPDEHGRFRLIDACA